ncbi:MAG TPA: hypothetical protein VFD43_11870, partial [Planctomycetota bacterium]|nr:hypothetical protein [Planctomycetota bacterium]
MIDLLRKHVVVIAGLALGWSGYSFHGDDDGKAAALAKPEMSGIDPAFLVLRDPTVPLELAGDRYRLEGPASAAGAAAG